MMLMGWFGLILLIVIIYFIVNVTSGTSLNTKEESPLSILDRRYAKGEIDEEEYIKRKNFLTNKN